MNMKRVPFRRTEAAVSESTRLTWNETSFALAAANVASEFQRTKVIPEIDAYRYSTLAAAAGITDEYTPAVATVYSELLGQIGSVLDITGGEGYIVAVISRPVYDMLMNSAEISKTIEVSSFAQGEVDVQVKKLNGVTLIPVPSARMKSEYTFLSGGTGETGGGFSPTEDAVAINWIICPKSAPVAISKTDNVKIITPRTEFSLLTRGHRLQKISRPVYRRQRRVCNSGKLSGSGRLTLMTERKPKNVSYNGILQFGRI